MNGLELVDLVEARLLAFIPSREVFPHAVPDGTLPPRYLFVYSAEGDEWSSRVVGDPNIQTPYLWVTSVSRNNAPQVAAREANWGAAEARKALRGFRPDDGWILKATGVSMPAIRNESLAATTFYAVEQFRLYSYISERPSGDGGGSS